MAAPVNCELGTVSNHNTGYGESMLTTTTTSARRVQNMEFNDARLAPTAEKGDMSRGDWYQDEDEHAQLGEFLSRPVNIANYTWTNASFNQDFYPWEMYFSDPVIKRKLENFARISCRLHVKFVVNASPFLYGSVRACYFPLRDQRSDFQATCDQVPFSQTLGVFIEPQNMTSAEMILPFFWPNNWLRTASANEFRNMGRMRMIEFATLSSANAVAAPSVTISVYAWAEEVRLTAPTVGQVLQSDEYAIPDDVVSGPATAVANVAGALTNVPIVGPFAVATQNGAKMVSAVAKLFGFSNPPVIDDVQPMQNKAFHAFANTETRMPIDRLCLDPKNEVTIDPGVAGLEPGDPLSGDMLWKRESFVQGAGWSGSNPVHGLIWSAVVSPGYDVPGTVVGPPAASYITTTPVAYFGRMFRFWRGSITYRFRIIKTKYHTGRLIISWDPNVNIANTFNVDVETACFSKIIDLAVDDEVEVTIPYRASQPLLECVPSTQFSNGTTPAYTLNPLADNGVITVRVQTVLTGPVVNPAVTVLAFVRPGPDFEFAVPKDIGPTISARDPAGVLQSEASPISGESDTAQDKLALITTGEVIRSLRPILHRASLTNVQFVSNPQEVPSLAPAVFVANSFHYRIPRSPGRDARGYSQAFVSSATVPWMFNNNHPIDWTLNCFGGYRGSVNMHFNTIGNDGASTAPIGSVTVGRHFGNPLPLLGTSMANTVAPGSVEVNSVSVASALPRLHASTTTSGFLRRPTGQAGLSLTNPRTQTAISVNVPQFFPDRFLPAFISVRDNDIASQVNFVGTPFHDHVVYTCTVNTLSNTTIAATPSWPMLEVYTSAGVDFQPLYFVCTPRLFTNPIPGVPAS